MWRRVPHASSMPVPSYPSEDADSHAHSPRRQVNMVQANASNYSTLSSQGAMPQPVAAIAARRATHPACSTLPNGRVVSLDSFDDANAYFEWISGFGTAAVDANRVEGQAGHAQREVQRSGTDVSMPDYTPTESAEQLAASTERRTTDGGLRVEEDDCSGHLKVPTNTPTACGQGVQERDGAAHDSTSAGEATLTWRLGMPLPILSHSSSLPADLASSLTNSLLNQPMPLHFQQPNFQPPATEIRSRKENRRQQPGGPSPPAPPTTQTLVQDHHEMRRVSQQLYMPSGGSLPVGVGTSQIDSPQSQDRAPRVSSMCSESGKAVTNDGGLAGGLGGTAEKGTKRIRHCTPVSIRAIDEEDEPRRGSPRVRLTPVGNKVLATQAD
ncbi:hypothetical protein CDD83_1354 [Cordyceps sp. RAO-2017]|nr:hypothetical protein CDD83_1354 [Cordyceps sp. RAO-2017]